VSTATEPPEHRASEDMTQRIDIRDCP
jgi:hypothetical protein